MHDIRYSNHALEKMDGLGISADEVESVITQGMKWFDAGRSHWHAQAAGVEVVFAKQDNALIVVTVYRAGREK
ncbi:DUF4258 domain-containing protein [Candidatus Woesearchaeota archaeon]|nr:DUF4258 domain-containing protein [Candidatus Woesearchaeota archaeon]